MSDGMSNGSYNVDIKFYVLSCRPQKEKGQSRGCGIVLWFQSKLENLSCLGVLRTYSVDPLNLSHIGLSGPLRLRAIAGAKIPRHSSPDIPFTDIAS